MPHSSALQHLAVLTLLMAFGVMYEEIDMQLTAFCSAGSPAASSSLTILSSYNHDITVSATDTFDSFYQGYG